MNLQDQYFSSPESKQWASIGAVALDISLADTSDDGQTAYADTIWELLQRGYQVGLFFTTADAARRFSGFAHPNCTILSDPFPPFPEEVNLPLALRGADCLWVSDDSTCQQWFQSTKKCWTSIQAKGNLPQLKRIGDLLLGLNPNAEAVQQVAQSIYQASLKADKPVVIGIETGLPEEGNLFIEMLQDCLQSMGAPFVEHWDFSALLPSPQTVLAHPSSQAPSASLHGWQEKLAGEWIQSQLMECLSTKTVQDIVYEQPPANCAETVSQAIPFPLFITQQSIILVSAQMAFVPAIAHYYQMRVLLQIPSNEMARQLYELPYGQLLDACFTEQYNQGEGSAYQRYLTEHKVIPQADHCLEWLAPMVFRINAKHKNLDPKLV